MSVSMRVGRWRVWLTTDGASIDGPAGWLALVERAAAGLPCHRSKHATTYRVRVHGRELYVKCYHRYRRRTDLKDMLRASKARQVLRVSAALAAADFAVPRVLAAGEERRGAVLRGAWVATAALRGIPLADRVAGLAGENGDARRRALAEKRRLLTALGVAVARLHASGFVAGDLVPANVWVTPTSSADAIAFLDHDRTRGGRAPAPWTRARRNLVQLNRVVLAGIVATDRARVYRAYTAERGWTRRQARRRLPWVIRKTIERRRRFDGVAEAAALGFRPLMRGPAPRRR